ncbi:response regulator receiver domain-containing protein [Paucimonas lemoignei]|uniref:Response regulator receiver domain-containing protein n=1 Tax=Paucimonas lemoignei TaxID=29443 RepID=A0A4R3HWZ5_PAULE|nr:response regulator [Paucimonas lemoignei]TCS37827.1 response regulator receiver domain-containing protein [Paucimonas lemoignei]
MNNWVLLVEDNADEALLARRAFASAGLAERLRVAEDGEAACRLLRQEPNTTWPVLILLDWQMTGMDGASVLDELRVLHKDCAGEAVLPIAVLSSSDDPGDIAAAYAAGASSYLRKPVDFDRFVDLVRDLYRYWGNHNVLPSPRERL